MAGREHRPRFEETEEDRARFAAHMAEYGHWTEEQRACKHVHKRCVFCGHLFPAWGTDEEKRNANVCDHDDCQRRLEDEYINEMESRQYQDYRDGLIVYGPQY